MITVLSLVMSWIQRLSSPILSYHVVVMLGRVIFIGILVFFSWETLILLSF